MSRLLERVAATFSEPERPAVRETFDGFGALILAREGRQECPDRARILDEAGWDEAPFSGTLRQRLVRHVGTCEDCDNCSTCRLHQQELVAPYAPVVIPLLISSELRDRVTETAVQISARQGPPPEASPVPSGQPPRRLPLVAGAGGALLVVCLLILGALVLGDSERSEPRSATRPTEPNTVKPLPTPTPTPLPPTDATSLASLPEPACDEVMADAFPRGQVEGWDDLSLADHDVSILGMEIVTGSIDLVAQPFELGTDEVIALFVRDGRLVERVAYVDPADPAGLRIETILDTLYPADVLVGDLPHRQGVVAPFGLVSNTDGVAVYGFEDCFTIG